MRPSRVTIRGQRSRWGSCSTEGNLSFSWRLIFAPAEVLDYVGAHEVAHLVHHGRERNVAPQHAHPGNRVHRLNIHGHYLAPREHLARNVLTPPPGRRAQIDHPRTAPEKPIAPIQFSELECRP